MKIWCVDYAGLNPSIYSKLFLLKEEAEEWDKSWSFEGAYHKMYQVEDIWGFAARNFERVIANLIESRTSDDGNVRIWNDEDVSLNDEIEALAEEVGIKQFSCERWETFENPGITIYAFSAAWVYDGELHHYTDTWEMF